MVCFSCRNDDDLEDFVLPRPTRDAVLWPQSRFINSSKLGSGGGEGGRGDSSPVATTVQFNVTLQNLITKSIGPPGGGQGGEDYHGDRWFSNLYSSISKSAALEATITTVECTLPLGMRGMAEESRQGEGEK
jgi:hypothetical protein